MDEKSSIDFYNIPNEFISNEFMNCNRLDCFI